MADDDTEDDAEDLDDDADADADGDEEDPITPEDDDEPAREGGPG